MDINPNDIVLMGHSVQLIDWGDAKSNICLSKLPAAPNKTAILRCILLMTEGIIEDALSKKVRRAARKEEHTPSGFLKGFWGC